MCMLYVSFDTYYVCICTSYVNLHVMLTNHPTSCRLCLCPLTIWLTLLQRPPLLTWTPPLCSPEPSLSWASTLPWTHLTQPLVSWTLTLLERSTTMWPVGCRRYYRWVLLHCVNVYCTGERRCGCALIRICFFICTGMYLYRQMSGKVVYLVSHIVSIVWFVR